DPRAALEHEPEDRLCAVRAGRDHLRRAGAGPGAEAATVEYFQTDKALLDDLANLDGPGRRGDERVIRLTGVRLRMLERVRRLDHLLRLRIDVVMALRRAGEAIGEMQAGVEPLRRVRRRHLPREHEAHLVVIRLGILIGLEVAVLLAPMRPAAGEPMEHLTGVTLAAGDGLALRVDLRLAVGAELRNAGLAEIFLREDVDRELSPPLRDVDVVELEDSRAVGVFDLGRPLRERDRLIRALSLTREPALNSHVAPP